MCKQRRYKVLELKRVQLNTGDEEHFITEILVCLFVLLQNLGTWDFRVKYITANKVGL